MGGAFRPLAAAAAAVFAVASAAEDLAGHWEGRIAIPNAPLAVRVDLARRGEADWSGTIDIPAQGAAGLELFRIRVLDGGEVRFAIRGVPGAPTFNGQLADGMIEGEFEQGGVRFPFRLSRDAVAAPTRPQEPEPPFPYGIEEVRYDTGAVTLAGTLTVPPGEGPHPVVLLISGSGPQNRDGELFGHKPFRVIADHLSRAGIAVLRADDPGTGASTAHDEPATSAEFAEDAAAGVRFLAADSRFGPLGLIGHSEGGMIAPLVASRSEDVDFVVLLAGPGVPGRDLMRRQNERIFAAAGVPGARRTELLALLDSLFDALAGDADDAEVRDEVERVVRRQLELNGVPASVQSDEQVSAAVGQAMSPWMRHFLRYDPRPALGAVRVPVLALNGELDVQVDAAQNLAAIAAALAEGGNDAVTIHRLAGLNHLFQEAQTGLPTEYAAIEQTVAPAVLDLIRDWILERTPSADG